MDMLARLKSDLYVAAQGAGGPEGSRTEAVAQSHDIDQSMRAEADQWLAAIVESSDDAILSKDLQGIITSWNRGAERLFGYSADEVIGRPINILIPADRQDEEPRILERLRRGERIDHFETVRQRKDGTRVEISLTVSPVKNAAGAIVGASKIARDITERKRAQERQLLLIREMNHRVKNLFAVASGVVSLSARAGGDAQKVIEVARGRLSALARAHALTLPELEAGSDRTIESTDLAALVQAILSPYADHAHSERVVCGGPPTSIGSNAVTSMALLLHEFATNAAKYGALSVPSGRVEVDWTASNGELTLTWREFDGPGVEAEPKQEGFGSLLVRTTVGGQLAGRLQREWNPQGLIVRLVVPLERLA